MDYIKLMFSLLSKKNIKKYLLGELEPSTEELDAIQNYLEKVRPKLLQNNQSNLIRQIEQGKVPYLKELSIIELDFLLSKNIELPELLKIIFAKGGMAKGFAVIEWDNNLLHYKKREVSFIKIKLLLISLAFCTAILCFKLFKSLNWSEGVITLSTTCLLILIFFPIYELLVNEQLIQKEIFSNQKFEQFINKY